MAINDGDSGASDGSSDLGIFEENPDAYDLEEDDDVLRDQYLDLIDELDDQEIDDILAQEENPYLLDQPEVLDDGDDLQEGLLD